MPCSPALLRRRDMTGQRASTSAATMIRPGELEPRDPACGRGTQCRRLRINPACPILSATVPDDLFGTHRQGETQVFGICTLTLGCHHPLDCTCTFAYGLWRLGAPSEEGPSLTNEPSTSQARTNRASWVGLDPREDDTRPPALTRARIVRAALRLIDIHGLPALTMRTLATELTVSPMALYNHVAGKEELLDLTLDLMLGEVDCSATDGDWLTQLRTLICNFHQVLSAHQHLTKVYCGTVKIGPHGLKITERAIRLLRHAGFSPPEADDAFMTLHTYTVGLHQMGRIAPATDPNAHENADDHPALPTDQIPSVETVNPYLGGVRKPGRFEYGLDTLLAGLRTKLDQAVDAPPQP